MRHKYLQNVATLQYNAEKCISCKRCTEVCPHRVFKMTEDKAMITDKDRCMECGACMQNCPTKAINVHAGVGCAYAIIRGWITGREPCCDC